MSRREKERRRPSGPSRPPNPAEPGRAQPSPAEASVSRRRRRRRRRRPAPRAPAPLRLQLLAASQTSRPCPAPHPFLRPPSPAQLRAPAVVAPPHQACSKGQKSGSQLRKISDPECRMWSAQLLSQLLPLWPLLLLSVLPPAQGSSHRSPPAPARPPCVRGGPSAPRHVCVWERAPPPSRSPRVPRSRRQVVPGTAPPATPSGFEEGPPSSQYPWAIVWGPTVSREDGGDPNSVNPGFLPLDYGFAAPHGLATPHPNSDSMRDDGDGLILGETPATLRPFLFGGRGEGVDPQLYVTITISIIIVLVATGIIFKFCWDRSQKRRRPSGQQGALRQEESQQPLTDLSPAGVTVLGAFGDSPTPTPDHEEPRGGPRPGMPQPKGAPAFQLNRIPLVNL